MNTKNIVSIIIIVQHDNYDVLFSIYNNNYYDDVLLTCLYNYIS